MWQAPQEQVVFQVVFVLELKNRRPFHLPIVHRMPALHGRPPGAATAAAAWSEGVPPQRT